MFYLELWLFTFVLVLLWNYRYPGSGASGGCELPRGWWESNLAPLEEQSVFFTMEPYLRVPQELLKSQCEIAGPSISLDLSPFSLLILPTPNLLLFSHWHSWLGPVVKCLQLWVHFWPLSLLKWIGNLGSVLFFYLKRLKNILSVPYGDNSVFLGWGSMAFISSPTQKTFRAIKYLFHLHTSNRVQLKLTRHSLFLLWDISFSFIFSKYIANVACQFNWKSYIILVVLTVFVHWNCRF